MRLRNGGNSPSTSTAVRTGLASSCDAARATCVAAPASTSPGSVADCSSDGCVSEGKSSASSSRSSCETWPQRTVRPPSTAWTSTTPLGRLRTTSPKIRPGTTTFPSVSPRTSMTASPVCSRSVDASRKRCPVSSRRVPPSTGRVGRVETVRLTQATASAKLSRSVVNFTIDLPGCSQALRCHPIACRSSGTLLCPELDPVRELLHLVVDAAPLPHEAADLLGGMHDRGVVTASESLADLREGQIRELASEVHRHLPCCHQQPRAARPGEVLDRDAEVGGRLGHDDRHRDLVATLVGKEVLQHDLRERQVDLAPIERRERGHADQCAFQFADVGLHL